MFDTHCHLNFAAFAENLDEVVNRAKEVGVKNIIVPGTDIETSEKAIKIAQKYHGIYAAVGIHPHHVKAIQNSKIKNQNENLKFKIKEIEKFLKYSKVLAIGEVGLDRHIYQRTKYGEYQVDEEFIKLQKEVFLEQAKIAFNYKKTLIIHNREATRDLLHILNSNPYLLSGNLVFHCCESNDELLDFAIKNKIYIGVDGDVTYNKRKQEFVKKVPLDLLVLETDSPFLKPSVTSVQRSSKDVTHKNSYNEPKNLPVIINFIAKLLKISETQLAEKTFKNSLKLFNISLS